MIFFHEIDLYVLVITITASYLLGSISFGILATKFMKLQDLRSVGSGNIGATNVLRTGNKTAAMLTLILDGGKGYVAVSIVAFFSEAYVPFAILFVFIGHIVPIYYRFKGGKGVATFLGIIFAINFISGLMVCFTWLLLAIISKKSSFASLGCSLVTPFFLFFGSSPDIGLFIIILTVLIWWSHKENIRRLILKTEPSINIRNNKKTKPKTII